MRPLALLDPWLLRRPFEGRAARRYAERERPAFGDLDERLERAIAPDLDRARRFLDVGAGTGAFAARLAASRPGLEVIALEPSATLTERGLRDGAPTLRGRAEELPLRDACVDVALCLSSLRHVADRVLALRELRRVVRPGGAAWIVEIDAEADPSRARAHMERMPDARSRLAFALFVLGACPPARRFHAAASASGWCAEAVRPDPAQPFFLLRLS